MYKKFIPIIILLIIIGLTPHISGGAGPLIPPPVFTNAAIQSNVTYDLVTGLYTYSYTIANPATNTGDIWDIQIDITTTFTDSVYLSSAGLTIPVSITKNKTFDEETARFSITNRNKVVPVGIRVPSGWGGDIMEREAGGTASFAARTGTPLILSGDTKGGFELISRGLPIIRNVEIKPWWLYVSEGSASEEDDDLADQIEDSLIFHTKTIGPTAPPLYSGPNNYLDMLWGYINECVTLGWLLDTQLKNTLQTEINTARSYLRPEVNDPTSAKSALRRFMDAINQASSSQRTTDAQGLLYYNAEYLVRQLPDTPLPPPPPVPYLNITPNDATYPVGTLHTMTGIFWIDYGGRWEYPGVPIKLKVTEGPNTGLVMEATPSFTFPATFKYTSKEEGTDYLEARVEGMTEFPEGVTSNQVQVTWKGGPDLAIELFAPPYFKGKGGDIVNIVEVTGNYGTTTAVSSVTRYFLSTDDIIDPAQDRLIGGRPTIWYLGPGRLSDKYSTTIQIPSDLPQGKYYLGACADATQSVAELNEQNNCRVNQLVVLFEEPSNQPPNCTKAVSTPDSLWPPNHKLVITSIGGVTDPDSDLLTLTIVRITQDEPVNGLGDGDTSPDGFIVSGGSVMLRAERSGKGNGRVYAVSFSAEDGKGGSCTGVVKVGVPHDQGKEAAPIDDGQNYDSTLL